MKFGVPKDCSFSLGTKGVSPILISRCSKYCVSQRHNRRHCNAKSLHSSNVSRNHVLTLVSTLVRFVGSVQLEKLCLLLCCVSRDNICWCVSRDKIRGCVSGFGSVYMTNSLICGSELTRSLVAADQRAHCGSEGMHTFVAAKERAHFWQWTNHLIVAMKKLILCEWTCRSEEINLCYMSTITAPCTAPCE